MVRSCIVPACAHRTWCSCKYSLIIMVCTLVGRKIHPMPTMRNGDNWEDCCMSSFLQAIKAPNDSKCAYTGVCGFNDCIFVLYLNHPILSPNVLFSSEGTGQSIERLKKGKSVLLDKNESISAFDSSFPQLQATIYLEARAEIKKFQDLVCKEKWVTIGSFQTAINCGRI